ncbi:MAG: C40 family peptidase [Cyclobacteriaceae bacterium]|nr:C40 family peptidase [Cyclobacteriaceae bacterium]
MTMIFFDFKSTQLSPYRALLFAAAVILLSGCGASRKAKLREQKTAAVIQTARSYTGTPYKYGGTTRAGMDCSALTSAAYRAIQVNLPRSADAQASVGAKVKQEELKPGDLVFFATGKKRKQITHVGIVTEVRSTENIKFIHASTSLGVVETNLFSDYYVKRYRGARRVVE